MEATMLLLGATGAVGQQVLRLALEGHVYSKVVAITRRSIEKYKDHPKLEQHIVNFERLEDYREAFQGRDFVNALGSTIKKAGSKERFFQIDHDYPLLAARLAKANGATRCINVSSVGAHPTTFTSNYLRVKGQLEQALEQVGFDSYVILRPSMLLGERQEKRLGEDIGKWFDKAFRFAIPKRYRGVHIEAVAARILRVGEEQPLGSQIYESEQIPIPLG